MSLPNSVEIFKGPEKEHGVSSGSQATKSAALGELILKGFLVSLSFFALFLYWKGADGSFRLLRRRGRIQDHDEAPPAVDRSEQRSEGELSDLHGDPRASPLPATERQQLEQCDHNNQDGGGSVDEEGGLVAALAGALNFGSVAASAQILRRRAILGGVARGCGRFLPGALNFLFVCSFVYISVYSSLWRPAWGPPLSGAGCRRAW